MRLKNLSLKTKLVRALFLSQLAVLICSQACHSKLTRNLKKEIHTSHGTLVALLPYKEGIVVMADKESRIMKGEVVLESKNDRNKIIKLGNNAVGFCTNHTQILGKPETDHTGKNIRCRIFFDATKELEKYFEKNGLGEDLRNEIPKLTSFILERIISAVQDSQNDFIGNLGNGEIFLQIGIVRLKPETAKPEGIIVGFLRAINGEPAIQAGSAIFPVEDLEKAKLFCFGRNEVFNQVKDGGTQDFENNFSDEEFRNFVRVEEKARQLDRNFALMMISKLLFYTRKYLPIVNPKGSVGKTVDGAIITKKGFEWIFRDKSSEEILNMKKF